jgi:hypothetical protein
MLIGGIIKRLKKRSREEKRLQHNDELDQLGNLVQTPFPDFHAPGPGSDSDITEVSEVDSDDEEAIVARQKRYESKADEDVAVFLKLAEQMSLESLLHILEGQARTQNLQYLQKYMKTENEADSSDSESDSDDEEDEDEDESSVGGGEGGEEEEEDDEDPPPKPLPKKAIAKTKQFRFAEVTNNQVRAIVYEVEPLKEFKGDLWWQEDEIRVIRKTAIETVRFYVRHRKDFIASVEQVFGAEKQQDESPRHVKKLADEAFVRGLEGHIVPVFATRRSHFRSTIVTLQADFVDKQDYGLCSKTLGDASVGGSQLAAKFALRMAQIDYLEALKSNMSRWRPDSTNNQPTEEFFDC